MNDAKTAVKASVHPFCDSLDVVIKRFIIIVAIGIGLAILKAASTIF